MKKLPRAKSYVMALVVALFPALTLAAEPTGDGWKSLFNGKDLTGWKVPESDNGHWQVVDGVIDNAQMPGVPETGPIGLQHHGGRLSDRQRERFEKQGLKVDEGPDAMSPASSLIQFRNIQIKRLDTE